jgi:SecD/SecF fusion protein
MKSFSARIAICVVPMLLAIAAVGWASYRYSEGQGGYRLGVDLVGGTILVYEIDTSKLLEGRLPEGFDTKKLAAQLKRRIDPNDLYNVTVRPVSSTRVEIILPTGGTHQARKEQEAWEEIVRQVKEEWGVEGTDIDAGVGKIQTLAEAIQKKRAELKKEAKLEEIIKTITTKYDAAAKRSPTSEFVQDVKEKIARQGSLEFRILASDHDDHDAIEAARQQIKDPKNKDRLETLRFKGMPPEPPSGSFACTVEPGHYTYSWVELGRTERQDFGLDNAHGTTPTPGDTWSMAEEARNKGEALLLPRESVLLYSRKIPANRDESASISERGKQYEYFVLTRDTERGKEVTGEYLSNAKVGQDRHSNIAVDFQFNAEGGNRFYELTSRNAPESEGGFHRRLAVVLDGLIESAPTVNDKIGGSGQISSPRGFPKKKADTLVGVLRSGALAATLKQAPVSENTIGPTLGEDTINAGFWSVIYAFVAILVFMAIYYRFAGLVACLALLANLLLTVAFMVVVHATFTLPGLAGLVLMIGMAVDANVLIYERLREERDRGASLALAIRNGYDRAFPTIIDTHLSSIFTAIVLYVVGNDQLKGFGVSLTVGLIISLFTSLYMTRLMFDIWLAKGWLHKLSMFRFFSRPNIDFMAIRYYFFAGTILLSLFGIAVFMGRGKDGLNIDFNGGTSYTGRLKEMVDVKTLRELLSEDRQKEWLAVKEVKKIGEEGYNYEIVYAKDGATRTVTVQPEQAHKGPYTPEEVAKRASEIPDLTVEQLFVSDPDTSQGDKSKLFTVLSAEKTPDLVQASIVRLLGEKLGRTYLKEPLLDPEGEGKAKGMTRGAKLEFVDKEENGEPKYGSPAHLTMVLEREFGKHEALRGQAKSLSIRGLGKEKEEQYQSVQLSLSEPVDAAELKKALEDVRTEFAQRPQPERLENFDSQLAAETQTRALYAILASWGAILLYLWFRFGSWTFGAAAVLCLIHDLTFTLGIIGFCHYIHQWAPGLATMIGIHDFKIDLPSVAALLTLVGYSVNDTIVVFDRIREVRGKNPELTPQMINDSVNQTLSRTLLASLATWLVVFVLFCFGGPGVHLFAFVMVVGVFVGTYSSIYIASPLLLIFGEGRQPVRPSERLPRPTPEPVA